MRHLLLALVFVGLTLTSGIGAPASPPDVAPVGQAEGLLSYRFDRADLGYADIVTLRSGVKSLGKAMEWADQVLLYDADGFPEVYRAEDVQRIEFRRATRHKTAPAMPDLTVAYVERLPRDPSWRGHIVVRDGLEVPDIELPETAWHPQEGAKVTFRAHVLNAGSTPSEPASCRVEIDETPIAEATVPALEPGKEFILEAAWPWKSGRHVLRAEVNPAGQASEINRWNNTLTEPTDALAVAIVVARDRYDAFRSSANIVDSFCFEDWARYQIACLNALLSASVYPSTPQGVTERLRCDRIIVVDDPEDLAKQAAWQNLLRRDGRPESVAEYAVPWVLGRLTADDVPMYDVLKVDWWSIRRLARELGLVNLWETDTTAEQCLVRDQYGRYLEVRHLFPDRRTLMYSAGAFTLDEPAAVHLNHVRGRPRGLRGDYLYQLPEKLGLDVRAISGLPLPGVQVDVFQLQAEGESAGCIAGVGKDDPLASVVSDEHGRVILPDLPAPAHTTPAGYALRPNPFGQIAADGSNGLLLLRLRQEGHEEAHFLRLFDCQLAYLHGNKAEYYHRIETHLATPGGPASPPYAAVKMDDRTEKLPPMYVRWPWPTGVEEKVVSEFRIYRRTGLAGQDARPWLLMGAIERNDRKWGLRYDGTYFEDLLSGLPYSLDTYYAVTAVDQQGRESATSNSGFIPYGLNSVKLTMDTEAAYISVTGPGECRLLRWDGVAGTQPFGVRTRRFPGYEPAFWGIVMGKDGRMIAADPVNHVLAFYENGDLVDTLPNRPWWPGFPSDAPGEFYAPADVAVDDAANLIVADSANNRVQVLDARGQFLGLVDPDFRFLRPFAVGCANGFLCVTDKDGSRCRVYRLNGPQAEFVCQLPFLAEADRALVGKSGKIYITGRDPQKGSTGILVYRQEGESAVFDHVDTEGIMGKFYRPRGLYQYRGGAGGEDFAYFVNEFPFDVGRDKLE